MYLTRSKLSRPVVFVLVTNLLVTMLKAIPHMSLSTSLIRFFQHWIRLFFMPRFRADFAIFHASCSAASPFERMYFHRAAKPSRCRTENWSFSQPSPSMSLVSSIYARSLFLLSRPVCQNSLIVL